ncbi:MAG: hypothetical protein AAFO69_16460 [Bacteroidota bacterium]
MMKKLEIAILTITLILVAHTAYAIGAPPRTPIDGGLGLLLAGGAVYGLKKIREARKNR